VPLSSRRSKRCCIRFLPMQRLHESPAVERGGKIAF
jgi:hypothetical protein